MNSVTLNHTLYMLYLQDTNEGFATLARLVVMSCEKKSE